MFELKPRNKYAWIKTIDEANRVGSLYTPGNVTNQYRLATIVDLDSECAESQGFKPGDVVLCDMIGVVSHRIDTQTIETCLIKNFLGVVVPKEETVVVYDPKDMEFRRVPKDHPDIVDSSTGKHPLKEA